ncbi:hypothetical protein SAMN05421788_1011210 [Filimonas lacunae]|uniref:MetA-pathway of phenol degradation n=1 Tax=Filimonas lacunae TaxID=477680 RepID=A0A173MR14_9BACT|nr:hypothetical protein [Filimonas lacunae]BAV09778.1 hypothetical protein FLA_5831 [Filimonas lacunae]SIS78830.1 hypothetical protein SAMN05421788_1011210 [Filimonas lacunae]
MTKYFKAGSLWAGLLFTACISHAQELFVFSEPASNMPAKSMGVRLTSNIMTQRMTGTPDYQLLPEVMLGVNKKLMLHGEGYVSNSNGTTRVEGGGVYAKYRFYTTDNMYRHFRLAAFGRAGSSGVSRVKEEIETNGLQKGYELGFIATQLLHKQAISASVSFEQVVGNSRQTGFPGEAMNYSLSTGRLLYPSSYTHYGQLNFNLMVELLGQHSLNNNKSFLDIAPAIQFIINSQTRIDVGYRQQLYSTLSRYSANSFLIRFEHTLFNVL